ncbi:MAG: hypothetical protein M3O50_17295 [Myxococcota bacterium]|nr:hypothetical protein [Myxococcota bacterium]
MPKIEEEPLDPLPPLDGGAGDSPLPEIEEDDLREEDTDATLDDATGENDPADARELDIEGEEDGWLVGAGEALDLDVGAGDLGEFAVPDSPADDAEDPGAGRDEDLGFEAMPESGALDAGEEGPLDADEELHEADLPSMDSDEDGELDAPDMVDPLFGADEPLGLQWSAQPWLRVGAPLALTAANAVVCVPRGALVVGRSEPGGMELLRIDLEGSCERLAAEGLALPEVTKLAADGNVVVAVLEAGPMLVSWQGGDAFYPLGGDVVASDAILASGSLWVRTRSGALVVADELVATRPSRLERLVGPNDKSAIALSPIRRAVAIAPDGANGIAALLVDDDSRPVAVVRGSVKGLLDTEAVQAPEARVPGLLAASGAHIAYAPIRGGVIRRQSSGEWLSFPWAGRVTALAFVDPDGTLVAATYSELDDTTTLVRLNARGEASVVARLGAAPADTESDGRVASMAHDEARGVVWVVGGFGVAVFAVR